VNSERVIRRHWNPFLWRYQGAPLPSLFIAADSIFPSRGLSAAPTPLGATPRKTPGQGAEVADIFEGRREHYQELAARVRAIAREARFPAARRALIEIAKRFDRRDGTPDHPALSEYRLFVSLGSDNTGAKNTNRDPFWAWPIPAQVAQAEMARDRGGI